MWFPGAVPQNRRYRAGAEADAFLQGRTAGPPTVAPTTILLFIDQTP